MEKRYLKPDGTHVWATLAVGLVRDGSTKPDRIISVIEDITPRKLVESKYAALNAELEARIAQRTRALHQANAALTQEFAQRERLQAQLLQTQKLEALGQMTAGFAHDFNNTLQAVASGFSMIDKWSEDSRIKQVAQMSLEAAHRGSSLVKQMLSFARHQRLEVRSVDLPKLLATLEPILQRAAPDATITIDCAQNTPAVSTDATLLEAALINFAVNAHDAMPSGRGTIMLRVTPCSATDADYPLELGQQGAVAISVTDNGSGIAPETLAHVMEPFFTTKDFGKGTGLGLASANGFAHQSGGAMRITSVLGEGTTVTLYLPRSAQIDANHAPLPHTVPAKAVGQHILLVDDDLLVRTLTALQLRDLGYTVTEVASARDALDYSADLAKFIGVVSDVTMPECDGPTMIAEMRNFSPALKVVYITGKPHSTLLEGEYILNKPFTVQALRKAMTHFG